MTDTDGKKILELKAKGAVKKQGLTELFFESAEPPFGVFSLDDFLDRFPAGDYELEGQTVDGTKIVGTASLTHDIPDAPVVTSPEDGDEVDPDDFTVTWDAVMTPGVEIVGYHVVVEKEDPLQVIHIDLPASQTSVSIPPEFMQAGTEYKCEVLAIEESGNQTITEVEFETE